MILEPIRNWVVGRVAIAKPSQSVIGLPGLPKGVTRCYLIDAVGPEAAKDGFAPGDLVVATKVGDLMFLGQHRVTFPIDDVIIRVKNAPLSEFVGIDGKPIEAQEAAA